MSLNMRVTVPVGAAVAMSNKYGSGSEAVGQARARRAGPRDDARRAGPPFLRSLAARQLEAGDPEEAMAVSAGVSYG